MKMTAQSPPPAPDFSSVSGYFHQLGTGGTIIVIVILFIVISGLRRPWER